MKGEKMITTRQAAEKLGVTIGRIHQFITEGRLPSQQFGRDHLIKEDDLKLVADRKPGRPPLNVEAKTTGAKKAEAKASVARPGRKQAAKKKGSRK